MFETIIETLRSRTTQLVIRGITLVLAAIFGPKVGADPALAGKLAAACPILVGVVFDLIVHSANYGKIMTALNNHAGIDPPTQVINIIKSKGTDTSTSTKVILVMISLMFALSQTGCGAFATPTQATPQDLAVRDVALAQTGWVIAVTTVETLHSTKDKNGKPLLSDADYAKIKPLEQVTLAYLNAASSAVDQGRMVDSATQLALFRSSLATLTQAYAGITIVVPTTQPQ